MHAPFVFKFLASGDCLLALKFLIYSQRPPYKTVLYNDLFCPEERIPQ